MNKNYLTQAFKALSDKTRQEILDIVSSSEKKVSEICSEFQVSQPTISHHLHILKKSGLVETRKEGKNIFYYTKKKCINTVLEEAGKKWM